MPYGYFQWGVTAIFLASAVLNILTYAKRRELNQRCEKMIEESEEQHQAHFAEREELHRTHIAERDEQFWRHYAERGEWHQEYKERMKDLAQNV